MSESKIWYGYLEAGTKSSPVVLDQRLETGNAKTIYLFNLGKKAIVEYSREIVEPKLRELNKSETGLIETLAAAFAEARKNFKQREMQISKVPDRGTAAAKTRAEDSSDEDSDASLVDSEGDTAENDEDWEDED